MTAERRDDTERWTSEGGANPPDPDDTSDPVAGQTEQPAQGSSVPHGEPAPQELGESG